MPRDHDDGANMIEYGLIASLISVVTITVLLEFGPVILRFYEQVQTALGG